VTGFLSRITLPRVASSRARFYGAGSGAAERLLLRVGEPVQQTLEVGDLESRALLGPDLDSRAEAFLRHRHLDSLHRLDQPGKLRLRLHQGSRNLDHEGRFNRRRPVPALSTNLPLTSSGLRDIFDPIEGKHST